MRIFTLLLAVACSLFAHASSIPSELTLATTSATVASLPDEAPVKARKLSKFQKWQLKIIQKKLSKLHIDTDERGLPTEQQRKQGKLSMIFGIASVALIFTPAAILALPAAIVGLILGIKSIKGNSNGQGIAGIVTSSVTLLLFLVAIILVAAWLSSWN